MSLAVGACLPLPTHGAPASLSFLLELVKLSFTLKSLHGTTSCQPRLAPPCHVVSAQMASLQGGVTLHPVSLHSISS